MPPSLAENQKAVAAVPERLSADDSRRVSARGVAGLSETTALEEAFAAAGGTCIHGGRAQDLIHVRTCRRLLGVHGDTPDELLKSQVFDSRITHEVVRATASWQDLGPRAGSSDASRLLRWLRCDRIDVDLQA